MRARFFRLFKLGASPLARIVMKFGGTSMAGTERIRRVAGIVRRQQAAGPEVAVVVSAVLWHQRRQARESGL